MEASNRTQQNKTNGGPIIITAAILWTTFNFRLELVKAFLSEGYKVYCVGDLDANLTESRSRLNETGAEVIRISCDRKSTNIFNDLLYFGRLLRLYRKLKPTVVYHFTPKPNIYGSLACRLLGIPCICTITGLGSGFLKRNFVSIVQLVLYRIAFRHQRIVFFQNNDDSEFFIKKKIVRAEQVRIMPGSGINTVHFFLPSPRMQRPLKFMFAGRLLRDKGFNEFIGAARHVQKTREDARFYIAGFLDEGNSSSVSKKHLDDLVSTGIIEYLGPFADIRNAFKLSDVIVLPSYREGLSRLLLEAASCNRPLIASDVPGCREIVHNEVNGLLCAAHSEESLYKAMIAMLDTSDNQLKTMGKSGRDIVIKHYNSNIVNHMYLETLRQLSEPNA